MKDYVKISKGGQWGSEEPVEQQRAEEGRDGHCRLWEVQPAKKAWLSGE